MGATKDLKHGGKSSDYILKRPICQQDGGGLQLIQTEDGNSSRCRWGWGKMSRADSASKVESLGVSDQLDTVDEGASQVPKATIPQARFRLRILCLFCHSKNYIWTALAWPILFVLVLIIPYSLWPCWALPADFWRNDFSRQSFFFFFNVCLFWICEAAHGWGRVKEEWGKVTSFLPLTLALLPSPIPTHSPTPIFYRPLLDFLQENQEKWKNLNFFSHRCLEKLGKL